LSILQIQSGGNLAFDLKKILEHEMVPKHEVLSKKESEELLKKYGITSDNLPKINENDPVVQVVKAKKGDVLRIIRQSPTAGEAVYFRLVV
jgi:DNA-directed RNA polymerase subunit H